MLLGMLPLCSLEPASYSADEGRSGTECRFHPADRAPEGFQGSAGYTPLLTEGTQDMVVGGRSRELNTTSIALLQPLLKDTSSESLTGVWRCKLNLTSHYSWLIKTAHCSSVQLVLIWAQFQALWCENSSDTAVTEWGQCYSAGFEDECICKENSAWPRGCESPKNSNRSDSLSSCFVMGL